MSEHIVSTSTECGVSCVTEPNPCNDATTHTVSFLVPSLSSQITLQLSRGPSLIITWGREFTSDWGSLLRSGNVIGQLGHPFTGGLDHRLPCPSAAGNITTSSSYRNQKQGCNSARYTPSSSNKQPNRYPCPSHTSTSTRPHHA